MCLRLCVVWARETLGLNGREREWARCIAPCDVSDGCVDDDSALLRAFRLWPGAAAGGGPG